MKFRTINESNDFQDLTDSQLELFSSKLIQLLLAKKKLLYRGVNNEYLYSRYTKNDAISESELYRRLFYYGDKSKHFLRDDVKLQMSKHLKDIEDISDKTFKYIFDELKNLKKSNTQKIKDFVEANKYFFDFFEEPSNKNLFVNNIIESDKLAYLARDYYLCILHRAGREWFADKSINISTSSSYESACGFGDNITLYIHRKTINQRKPFQTKNLPLLNKGSDIFPEQQELTVSAGLFAQNMLGVIHRDKELFTVNPHIFSDENLKVDLSKKPLYINQRDFGDNIALETSYTRWVYTYDFLEMFCGTEEANNLFF